MAETMTVRIRNIWGNPREVELTDQGQFYTPGSELEQQLVMTATGTVLIRKFVSRAAGRGRPGLYQLLDNEIRAGTRLGQVYGGSCPPELPTLVAYNADAEEPFALLRTYEGNPLDGRLGQIDNDGERTALQISLVRALQMTGAAGVVHGAVGLDHLRWNGERIQLIDFEAARRVRSPHRSDEAGGAGDVREDLAPAGRIIRQVAMRLSAPGSLSDHARDPEQLRAVLEGVFLRPEQRPYAIDLLRRMLDDTPLPPLADPEAALAEGRMLFDEALSRRRNPPPVPEPRKGRRPGRWFGLMLTTAAVVSGLLEVTRR